MTQVSISRLGEAIYDYDCVKEIKDHQISNPLALLEAEKQGKCYEGSHS